MKNLEFNKLFASVLVLGITLLSVSNIVDVLYHPKEVTEYGYVVEVSSETEVKVVSKAFNPDNVDLKTFFVSANIESGKKISKKCVACHTFDEGGHNKVGPNLWNIIGKDKAHLKDSFKYSNGMKEKGGIWDYSSLIHFLYKPSNYIKGTKMSFAGLSKPEDLANIIFYLRSLNNGQLADLP